MIFTIFAIVFVLMIGGLAVDMGHMVTVDNELERAMDAAALAAAGKLGFDDTAFPAARQFAHDFAAKNEFRVGTIGLNLNTGNAYTGPLANQPAPYGDVVLGIWDSAKPAGVGPGQRFEPSNDGFRVNAAWCRYKTTIPTALLRLWGITALEVSAEAVATSDPPRRPPNNACVFPIGLPACAFRDNGAFTSQGCGVAVKYVTGGGQPADDDSGTNTVAWVDLHGSDSTGGWTPPTPSSVIPAMNDAANGACASPPRTGQYIGATNGAMADDVFSDLKDLFLRKWSESGTVTVEGVNSSGNKITAYSGKGWPVYVPIIGTDCPPKGVNQGAPITGWTRMVVTQVIVGGECVVTNHYEGNAWDAICAAPSGLNGVFGYYQCEKFDSPPTSIPGPRSSLAIRNRIVQ